MSMKKRKQIKVSNDKNRQFDQRMSFFDLPLDEITAVLESIRDSASIEDMASTMDQKLKQISSSYRNGDFQIVIDELPKK